MIGRTEIQKVSIEELEEVISKAMSRVNVQKEIDLCQYIPGAKGRLHHFAFGKLKKRNPAELLKMVNEHILENDNPARLAPTQRSGLK